MTPTERSDKIVAWLKCKPMFKHTYMCQKVGYQNSSMARVLKGDTQYPAIPEKYLDGMEAVMKEYGYVP